MSSAGGSEEKNMLPDELLHVAFDFLGDRRLELAALGPDGVRIVAAGDAASLLGLAGAVLRLHREVVARAELHVAPALTFASLGRVQWQVNDAAGGVLRLRFPFAKAGLEWHVRVLAGSAEATVAREAMPARTGAPESR